MLESSDLLLFFLTLASAFIGVNFGGTMLLIMPMLLGLGYSPLLALSATRPAVISQSLVGMRLFRQYSDLNRKEWLVLFLSAAAGGYIGVYALSQLNPTQSIIIMSALLVSLCILAVIRQVWTKRSEPPENTFSKSSGSFTYMLVGFSPAIIGGLVGAGGGPLVVFLSWLLLKKGLKQNAYLEKVVSLGHSIAVCLWLILMGHYDLKVSLLLLLAATLGGWLGAKVTLNLNVYWMYAVIILVCIGILVKRIFLVS